MKKLISDLFENWGYKADKPKHFWYLGVVPATGVLIICFWHFFRYVSGREWIATGAAMVFVGLLGIGKEVVDYEPWKPESQRGDFDWMDIVAAEMGAAFVCVVFLTIYFTVNIIF